MVQCDTINSTLLVTGVSMHRKVSIKALIGIVFFVITLATLMSLFATLFDESYVVLCWSIAIDFLLATIVMIILIPKVNDKKYKLRQVITAAVMGSIGGIMFIVDAFVFIDNLLHSFMLVVGVASFIVAVILFSTCNPNWQDNK